MSIHHTQLHNDRNVADTATSGGYSGNNIAEEQVDENATARKRELEKNALDLALDGKLEKAGLMETSVKPAANATDTPSKKNKKDRANLAYQLALLDAIRGMDSAIGALQDIIDSLHEQIAVLKAEIEELDSLGDLIESGAIDPNNPQHAALMAKYGITENDIKNDTYKNKIIAAKAVRGDKIASLEEQIAAAKEKQAHIQEDRDAAMDKIAEKRTQVAEKANLDTRDDYINTVDNNDRVESNSYTNNLLGETAKLRSVENNLTELTLEKVEEMRGTSQYIEALDELVDSMDDSTLNIMLEGASGNPALRQRINIHFFNRDYADIAEFKGEPEFGEYVEELLADLDEGTKAALLADENTPAEVKAVLGGQEPPQSERSVSYASSLDDQPREDEETLQRCFNNCAVGDIPAPETPAPLPAQQIDQERVLRDQQAYNAGM